MIIKGKKKKPAAIIAIGVPGIGKSRFGESCPYPLFMGAEENDELSADRLPIPDSWEDAKAQARWVLKNKVPYKTLVIDTIDSLQQLLHAHVLKSSKNKTGSMAKAHGGYGAGFDISEREFLEFRNILKALRDEKGMHIVILGHVKKSQATDPILGLQYDTFEMNLHHKEQAVFVDWCSAVMFANYVSHTAEMDNTSDKKFVIGEGERVLLTEKRPGHLGKNRYKLPYELEMPEEDPSGPFWEGYEAFYSDVGRSTEQIKGNISKMAGELDEGTQEKIKANVEKAGNDVARLEKLEQRVKVRLEG
jgi:hypothetical protein